MFKKFLFVFHFLLLISLLSHAQDMISLLGDSTPPAKEFTKATFKTTRLINTQTVETLGKRTLDFRISHRFGALNSGFYNAYGVDGSANIRLSLEYSYDGRLMAGIGRSSFHKVADGFLKYRLYRQTDNDSHPLGVTLFSGMYYVGENDPDEAQTGFDKYELRTSRLSYAYEIIAGRKFSSRFSLQVAPFYVHYNLAEKFTDKNDMYGVSGAFRFKFSKRSAITAEYSYRISKYSFDTYYDSMGIGYEIETGGHVFQIHFTNSFGIVESQFLAHTDSKWSNAGVRLGFNISRVFTL